MRKIKTGKPLSERENESLNRYLDEIGKELLLSDDEEKQLAEKIQNGGSAGDRAVKNLSRQIFALSFLLPSCIPIMVLL